jgi:hypothetical protein
MATGTDLVKPPELAEAAEFDRARARAIAELIPRLRQQEAAFERIRGWPWPRKRRKTIFRAVRRAVLMSTQREMRDLRRMLAAAETPIEDVSRAAPALLRCLFIRQNMMVSIVLLMLAVYNILIFLPFIVGLRLFHQISSQDVLTIVTIYVNLLVLIGGCFPLFPNVEFKRIAKYFIPNFEQRYPKHRMYLSLIGLSIFVGINRNFDWI